MYGDNVNLVAQTKNKFAFLIFEVFEEWENLPDDAHVENDTVSFVANADVNVTTVYRDDYTIILVVLFTIMILIVGFKYYKRQ